MPKVEPCGFFGDTVFNAVSSTFCLFALPWRIRERATKTICATGAFMLVRRTAFDRTPGFQWLKLEVADDFGLCLMIKAYGGRCDMLHAREDVKIAWYSSLLTATLAGSRWGGRRTAPALLPGVGYGAAGPWPRDGP